MQSSAVDVFLPNRVVSGNLWRLIIAAQVLLFLGVWMTTPAVIPKPLEVASAAHELWSAGIVADLLTSLTLYLEAVVLATILSFAMAYLSAVPALRPIAEAYSKLRFLGMIGLPFLFTLYIHGAHALKLALLTFSISVFVVTGMLDVLDAIPSEKFDLARTLRMGEWQVVWEVMVLGRIDVAFDVVRSNAAIGWMMLATVEGLFKSEGGIGAVMEIQSHHFHLASIAAIQLMVLGLGLLQDYGFAVLKEICCPYAKMLMERR